MAGDWITIAVVIGGIVLGLVLLSLAVGIFIHAVATGVSLFAWAAEHGFVGVALYIILWVIATPLMIVVCIIGGVIRLVADWASMREENPPGSGLAHRIRQAMRSSARAEKPPELGSVEYLDWANRRGRWAKDQPERMP